MHPAKSLPKFLLLAILLSTMTTACGVAFHETFDGTEVFKAISLAGVMGGESTEISSSTTTVVIEAAYWEPTVIARTARRHRLPSEASRRFERAVDPWVAVVAAEAAAELLVRYGGGMIVGRSDVAGNPADRTSRR